MKGLLSGLAAVLLAGCGVRVTQEEKLVFHYSEGIQSQNQSTYDEYYLACHPSEVEKNLEARLAAYEALRRKGSVVFSADGIEMIKLGALGRGAYFGVRDAVQSGDALRFKTVLRPDYLSINFSEFPPGAVVYVLAEPLGSVLALRTGTKPGPERRILESVDLQWEWTKKPNGASVAWCLSSVIPLTETATFKTLRFRETPLPNGTLSSGR